MKANNFTKYKIGMRTVKTAIAVTIGLYLSYILNLNSPIFVAIGAITTMQPSFTQSFKNIKDRIFTAIFGVILGYIFSLITNDPILFPIVAGIGIVGIIWVLQVLHLKNLIPLTTIIFMASFTSQSDKILYGINRVIGTTIGLFVALIINYTIFSPKVHDNFYDSIGKSYRDVLHITINTLVKHGEKDIKKLSADLDSANNFYNLLREEISVPFRATFEIKRPAILLNLFNEIFLRYQLLSTFEKDNIKLNYKNLKLIEKIFKYTIIYNDTIEDEEAVVYNYHINTILRNILEIRDILNKENYYGGWK